MNTSLFKERDVIDTCGDPVVLENAKNLPVRDDLVLGVPRITEFRLIHAGAGVRVRVRVHAHDSTIDSRGGFSPIRFVPS